MSILHLVFHHIQGLDWGPIRLKKQSECNKSDFAFLARLQNLKYQYWSPKNSWHYSGDLWDGTFYFFMLNKDGKKRYYKERFLLADINLDVILGMLFLIMSNADVDFQTWNLQ